jgi:branched-chain amino acid aminotransferase
MTNIMLTRLPHDHLVPADERARLIADPGFGKTFTDHMVTIRYTEGKGWHDATIGPRGPLSIGSAALCARDF